MPESRLPGHAVPTTSPTSEVRLYRIAGTITDAGGNPVAGIHASLNSITSDFNASDEAITDMSGRYDIDGLRPGRYDLEVWVPGPDDIGMNVLADTWVLITTADALGVDLRLPEPTPARSPAPRVPLPARLGALRVDGIAQVLANDLVVRSAPFVGTASKISDEHLASGDRLFIVAGPVDASGYRWYEVAPMPRDDSRYAPFGWVAAASRDGEPWIEGLEVTCPSLPVDLAGIAALAAPERVACFGRSTLTFAAYYGNIGIADGPGCHGEPDWLNSAQNFMSIDDGPGNYLAVTVAPTVDAPDFWRHDRFRISGHFDDPAAADCRMTCDIGPNGEAEQMAVAAGIFGCRATFVITAFEPVS